MTKVKTNKSKVEQSNSFKFTVVVFTDTYIQCGDVWHVVDLLTYASRSYIKSQYPVKIADEQ